MIYKLKMSKKNLLLKVQSMELEERETLVKGFSYEPALFKKFFPKHRQQIKHFKYFENQIELLLKLRYLHFTDDHDVLEHSYWVTKEGAEFLQSIDLSLKDKIWYVVTGVGGIILGSLLTCLFTG